MTARLRRRERLGRWSGLFGGRQIVYAIDEGLEVDELDGYDVARRRVFWEDVLLVTYHRYIGVAFPLAMGLSALVFAWIAIAIGADAGSVAGALWFAAICCTPFVVALGLRLALGVDVVTVFGRRTMARMRFGFLKARARRTFDMVVDRARRAQDEIARRQAEEDASRAASAFEAAPAAGGPPPLAAEAGAFAPPSRPDPAGAPAGANVTDDRDAATGRLAKRESVKEQDGREPPGAFEPPPVSESDAGPGAGPA